LKPNPYPWLDLARRIQSIAQAGLTFCTNEYDRERYRELLAMSADIMAGHSNLSNSKLKWLLEQEQGYLTPKVDVRGVVFRGDCILLVRETIDGRWSLPGGWADVGLSPREVVEKEVREESGLEVEAVRLLALFDKKCHPHPPDIFYIYKLFSCFPRGSPKRVNTLKFKGFLA
jgi:ADP-ribose pyrophosphatase YjhB (NUDIX family)